MVISNSNTVANASAAISAFFNVSKGYMMETSTGSIVEGQMQPMDAAPITQQVVVTGQYLYDNFVVSDEAQITKMGMIRNLATQADALQIKGACDKMVERAKEVDAANGVPEKTLKDGKEVPNRGPKTQQAMNARTIIQQAWGALKFAQSKLEALGYNERTGYQDMRVLAKRALDEAMIKWNGEHALTQADRERKQLQKATKGQMDALQQVQKDNPMQIGESMADWNTRTIALAQVAMEKARADQTEANVKRVVEDLSNKYDSNTLYQIAEALMAQIGLNVAEAESETTVEETEDTAVEQPEQHVEHA